MKAASCYAEWREFALQLDKLEGGPSVDAPLYDKKLLAQKLAHLRKVREIGNLKDMMFALRTDLIRNVANIAKW